MSFGARRHHLAITIDYLRSFEGKVMTGSSVL